MFHLYILQSEKHKRFYIGTTHDLNKRLKEHNSGKVKSTKPYRPYQILHTESYFTKTLARKREIELKKHGQKRRALLKSINGYGVSPCG